VVAHEAVSMDLPAGGLADLAQCLKEELAVFVVLTVSSSSLEMLN
jgi:hypothetical protein